MLEIVKNDEYLLPYENALNQRHQWFKNTLGFISKKYGSLENFASAYTFYGFNFHPENKQISFREWLPNAQEVYLVGEFNQWNNRSHPLQKIENGNWEIWLKETDIVPESKLKLCIITSTHNEIYKIPAYIQYVVQNPDFSYDGVYLPPSNFQWKDAKFPSQPLQHPIIYEAHIGMATEEHKVGSYVEFADAVLPHIQSLGYNALQLMAIQEHPYYGSFGYQVANFFAPSSRFGTPDELRYLINKAHEMDMTVILDIVHSHAVKNEWEGLSFMDGTDIYFNGNHPDWDSRLFDYGKEEVKQFLLSNLHYWIKEFHFDGFRFDGVTSMLYHHFGHVSFDNYSKYFENTNNDAIIYLQLANTLIHQLNTPILSICEDMSGMPGACIPVEDGGLGFDFRLGMGIPDYWMDVLENVPDENWNMGEMFWRLTNRRLGEKTIGYAESHDQALVGDKTIAFWLMDKEMYTHMSVFTDSLIIDRGIALHKLIRFITILLGGEGYMNFIGNEFGHPEWVDFPREGNHNSYQYARRQWSLLSDENLKYKFLNAFDKAMIHFVKEHSLLDDVYVNKLYENNEEKILVFEKQGLIFLFNFSRNSYTDFQFYLPIQGNYKIIFSSDEEEFGGYNRISSDTLFQTKENALSFYLPNRGVWVLQSS